MSDTETSTSAAPMRLRAEPPRVTRLSRKVLASTAAVALVGIGGALIYALQTHGTGQQSEEPRSRGVPRPHERECGTLQAAIRPPRSA